MSKFVLMLQIIENHLLSIVTKAFKRCKDSYFCKDFLITYLHTIILNQIFFSQIIFQLSNKIFLKYLRIF
jgi:hypothetical protein